MRLTLHATRRTPHGASRLVQAIPTRSVNTRRATSWHYSYAKIYRHKNTAKHDMSTNPPALATASADCYSNVDRRQHKHSETRRVVYSGRPLLSVTIPPLPAAPIKRSSSKTGHLQRPRPLLLVRRFLIVTIPPLSAKHSSPHLAVLTKRPYSKSRDIPIGYNPAASWGTDGSVIFQVASSCASVILLIV